jgi:hypothetical protein
MRYRILEGKSSIRWGVVLNSFRYYVLTGQIAPLSLMIMLIVLRMFRISLKILHQLSKEVPNRDEIVKHNRLPSYDISKNLSRSMLFMYRLV